MPTPKEETNATPDPIFDPFPEPQTMPSGWDLSVFIPDPDPVTIISTEEGPEAWSRYPWRHSDTGYEMKILPLPDAFMVKKS